MPILDFKPMDAANVASKLPRPLQKPAGIALQTLLELTGANDPATSIVPEVGMVGTSTLSGRGALREALSIIKDYSKDMDPIKKVMLERVTPAKVPHRTPINVPRGFELPKEFGPNYTSRPQSLIDSFVASKEIPTNKMGADAKAAFVPHVVKEPKPTKFNELQIKAIRDMMTNGASTRGLAKQYGISETVMRKIKNYEIYKWVP